MNDFGSLIAEFLLVGFIRSRAEIIILLLTWFVYLTYPPPSPQCRCNVGAASY